MKLDITPDGHLTAKPTGHDGTAQLVLKDGRSVKLEEIRGRLYWDGTLAGEYISRSDLEGAQ